MHHMPYSLPRTRLGENVFEDWKNDSSRPPQAENWAEIWKQIEMQKIEKVHNLDLDTLGLMLKCLQDKLSSKSDQEESYMVMQKILDHLAKTLQVGYIYGYFAWILE